MACAWAHGGCFAICDRDRRSRNTFNVDAYAAAAAAGAFAVAGRISEIVKRLQVNKYKQMNIFK